MNDNSKFWVKVILAVLALGSLVALSLLCGCKAFYENAGASVRMGSVTAPIEFSEPTSEVKVRALYAMDGIDFYAAKNCVAKMKYKNTYTNSYIGLVETKGVQEGEIEIEPTEESSEANAPTEGANSTPATTVADE